MGFGYKTEWIAVRDRSVAEVADVLRLAQRLVLGWEDGTDRAYTNGVYVASPVSGWTCAHGRIDFADAVRSREEEFPDWLSKLSQALGDVQYYCSERTSDSYAWARATGGNLLRACSWTDGYPEVCEGEPTPAETRLGLGLESIYDWNTPDEDDEHEFGGPSEESVLVIAGTWGFNPAAIDDATIESVGIYGFPPESANTARLKATLAKIPEAFGKFRR